MKYSAGMVGCLFWLSETRKTAELLLNSKDEKANMEFAVRENIYQVRAEDRACRIFRETCKRLKSLPDSLIEQIVNGDIGTVKLLVLICSLSLSMRYIKFH